MLINYRTLLRLLLPAAALAPSFAHATTSATFSFTPVAGVPGTPPAAAAAAVPMLGDFALLGLGLLLAVAAVRTLQAKKASVHKLLGIALLATGVTVSVIGTGRATAGVLSFIFGTEAGNLDCAGVTDQYFNPYDIGQTVTNNCTVSGQITTALQYEPLGCYLGDGTCDVLSPGATCTLPDLKCPPP